MYNRVKLSGLFLLGFVLFFLQSCTSGAGEKEKSELETPKNIIIFISDGMGYNHLKATNYYQYGQSPAQVFEQPDWTHFAIATYSSVVRFRDEDTIFSGGYNPQKASTDPEYLKLDYTDSGAAGTALSSGKKTYNGSIGIGIYGDTLTHMSQAAKALGKSTGVVSSVPLSHATPASFIAHNHNRNNYEEIAKYLFFHTQTDVIMAAGNPDFDDNGNPAEMNPRYVGGIELWEMLKANENRTVFETSEGPYHVQDANGDGEPDPWTVIQTREEFQQMAGDEPHRRVLGVPQVYATLQQGRAKAEDHTLPFQTPMNEGVARLEEMTKAAINVLSQNPNGFFVMIEGGAVDWASHDNHSGRMIEEQIDFNKSVEAAVEWVETYSSWDETLIIVTSDHECGYLTGPGEPNPVYPPVTNNGEGNLPGMEWHFGSHTNVLVPFFAKGPGTKYFELMAGEHDPMYGPFIQNTDIANLVFMMWGKPETESYKFN
ncbi:MAG: alkaline phosphatase [Bacteroidales bacterium]